MFEQLPVSNAALRVLNRDKLVVDEVHAISNKENISLEVRTSNLFHSVIFKHPASQTGALVGIAFATLYKEVSLEEFDGFLIDICPRFGVTSICLQYGLGLPIQLKLEITAGRPDETHTFALRRDILDTKEAEFFQKKIEEVYSGKRFPVYAYRRNHQVFIAIGDSIYDFWIDKEEHDVYP